MSKIYGFVAMLGAIASLLLNFGIIDLVDSLTGAFTDDTAWVLDAGWGALFGILVPVGLVASLKLVAGVQQVALTTFAIALAALAGEAWRWFVLVAILAGIVALSPRRRGILRFRFSWLAALAVVPCALYAEHAASLQRRHAPPNDSVSNGFHHWTALAALGIAVPLLGFGSRLAASSAAAAAAVWALVCLLHPDAAGGEGRGWAIAALLWAVALTLMQMVRANRRIFPLQQ